mmetsp:Transcript_27553/g.60375  ORF Transcript_27553/g.60375 Transcript_27553/m.60375 type:complete len:102 (-) Transcript_27553:257-562(-)
MYDAYAFHIGPSKLISTLLLIFMPLVEFCKSFHAQKTGRNAGKIKPQDRNIVVNRFQPSYPPNKHGPNYNLFGRYSLIKYRPWTGTPFADDGITDDHCIPI